VVEAGDWPYAVANAEPIDRYWQQRTTQKPGFFNGIVHMLTALDDAGPAMAATFRPVEFKSFLHWRDHGFPEAGVRDAFGSALIRSAEGHVILGRQARGNLNRGVAYPPGGFIDPRDVTADGTIDIEGSVLREVAEETGLGPGDLMRVPGFIVTVAGPQVSISVELRSPLPAEDLARRIRAHIASEAEPELADVVIVDRADALPREAMPFYTTVLLGAVFAE